MNETEFAYRVRQALNEGAERLDYRSSERLRLAREAALARLQPGGTRPMWVPALRLAPAAAGGMYTPAGWAWLRRLGVVAPLLALAIGFVGLYQWHSSQQITELADIDLAVLLDDTPIQTYADKGFSVMLRNEQGM